jgi:hypothetical protein
MAHFAKASRAEGGLAEWSNAPHSKRGWEQSLTGSNPVPSAI